MSDLSKVARPVSGRVGFQSPCSHHHPTVLLDSFQTAAGAHKPGLSPSSRWCARWDGWPGDGGQTSTWLTVGAEGTRGNGTGRMSRGLLSSHHGARKGGRHHPHVTSRDGGSKSRATGRRDLTCVTRSRKRFRLVSHRPDAPRCPPTPACLPVFPVQGRHDATIAPCPPGMDHALLCNDSS